MMDEEDDLEPILYLPHEQRMAKQAEKNKWLREGLEQIASRPRDNSHLNNLDPIFNMGPAEASAFVRKCDSAMKSHASDFEKGHDKEAALSAFEAAMGTLLEIRPAYPDEHAHIDEVLRRHGYSIREN